MEQRTPEWFAIRCGKVTASRVADVIARTKTGFSTSRANYKAQLVCERLTGCVEEGYTNAAMQWGIDKEPDALAAYSFRQDVDVVPVGFVDHPLIDMAGASPDGLIGADGLVEVKCPIVATHIETLLGQSVPARYETQIQWQLACTERMWCDFVSFDPRVPASMQLFIQRIHRDDDQISILQREVEAFLREVVDTVEQLRTRYELVAA